MKTTRHAIYLALAGVIGFAAPGIAPARVDDPLCAWMDHVVRRSARCRAPSPTRYRRSSDPIRTPSRKGHGSCAAARVRRGRHVGRGRLALLQGAPGR